jgi:hypothetical protein
MVGVGPADPQDRAGTRQRGSGTGTGGYRSDMTGFTGPDGRPLTVAQADDHPVVRAGLRTLLQADESVRVVGAWKSGRPLVLLEV